MTRIVQHVFAALLALAIVLPAHAQKISADPTAATIAGGEFLAGVQSGGNVKVLPSQLLTYVLGSFYSVNAQTGTTYTYVSGDRGKLVTQTNASAIAGTLPQATGSFGAGWFMLVQNRGAGTLTITPTTSTVDGATTLVLTTGQGAFVISDGTNYFTMRGGAAGASVAGSTKQVQYNNAGALGAKAGFEFDSATDILSAVNVTTTGRVLTAAAATGGSGLRLPHGTAPTSPVDGDLWTTSAGGLFARINGTTVGPFAAAGGGSLTNWTEAANTATPNSTVPVVSFAGSNTATNVDIALRPKGAGGLALLIADATSAGGNKRGIRAVDLQLVAGLDTAVASGQESFVAGARNTASGPSSLAIGDTNVASSSYTGSVAGFANIASAYGATNIGGTNNTADGQRSINLGGQYQNARGITGITTFGTAGQTRAATNKRQGEFHALATSTTDATATKMATDGGTAGAANQILLNISSAVSMTGTIVARHAASGDVKAWSFSAVVKQGASASTTALVGTPTVTVIGADSGASAWAFAIVVDTTNGAASLQFTGEAAKTIISTASVMVSQLTN